MLTDQELATVLAALRHWQQSLEEYREGWAHSWPHFADCEPLSAAEVERLCESLNSATPRRATSLIKMCRQVADSAANWADCSDFREAIAVFKELGDDCRQLLESLPDTATKPRYVIYDFDADELVTTLVYDDYAAAKSDADQLDNTLILELFGTRPTGGQTSPGPG